MHAMSLNVSYWTDESPSVASLPTSNTSKLPKGLKEDLCQELPKRLLVNSTSRMLTMYEP